MYRRNALSTILFNIPFDGMFSIYILIFVNGKNVMYILMAYSQRIKSRGFNSWLVGVSQKLSLAIQMGNVAGLLDTMPRRLGLDELLV